MDEPFGAVDPIVRDELQRELLRLQRELGKTIVFVTHDIDEAFLLGDQVVILKKGGRSPRRAPRPRSSPIPPTTSSPASSEPIGASGHLFLQQRSGDGGLIWSWTATADRGASWTPSSAGCSTQGPSAT